MLGYALSFWLLVARRCATSRSGRTYAIWAGAGTAAIAVIGMAALGEPATALKIGSIALIILGVIGLNARPARTDAAPEPPRRRCSTPR